MKNIDNWLKEHVQIVFSPFRELVLSLHVLQQPAHHLNQLEWAEKTLNQMSKKMRNEFQMISEGVDGWSTVLDLFGYLLGRDEQPEDIINRIECMPNEQFNRILLNQKISTPLSELNKFEREVQLKPQVAKEKLCHFLYEYQQIFFARELFRIEPFLQKETKELIEKFEYKPYETISQIHPRFKIENNSIKFFKAQTYIFNLNDVNSLTVFPSAFAVPHLWVDTGLPDLLVVYHVVIPNQKSTHQMVPSDLIASFKAMSDKSRLLILRELLTYPLSTQELAEQLGLANATVSKHLKILESAGLITAERRGYFVYYKAKHEKIQMLRVDMDQFFDAVLLKKRV
jgi:DNA-binding transcriptional ArsR family regulator